MTKKASHLTQAQLNYRSQQMNQNNSAYQASNNHTSDQKNANKGTDGVNETYSKVHGNRGKQKNPNQKDK